MGCCASKDKEPATLIQNVQPVLVTAGDTGVIAGGAVAGAAVAGPFAPVGAIIGGVIAAAAVGTVGQKVKDKLGVDGVVGTDDVHRLVGDIVMLPGKLTTDLWRLVASSKEVLDKLPAIGMLRLDRGDAPLPPLMLDNVISGNTNSKLFRVHPVTVKGLTAAVVRAGEPLSASQLAALDAALEELSKAGVIAVVGDSGMLGHHQWLCAERTATPVMLSPLLQAPLLANVLPETQTVLVVTSDARTFGQSDLEALLLGKSTLLSEPAVAKRFVLRGLEHLRAFREPRTPVPLDETQDALIELIGEAKRELDGKGTPLGAVLFESAMLPAFSDVVRKEFGLLVCDNFTLTDFALKARTDNPRFGVEFGNQAVGRKLDASALPAIGILRIDYTYPAAVGDAAHPSSYYYRTPHSTWAGLTFEAAQEGRPLTEPLRLAMKGAVASLESHTGVMGVAGDCGFLMNYQDDVRAACTVPCFVSALLQCSILSSLFGKDELILVLTANGPALAPHMPRLLTSCHITDPEQQSRFVVAGCQDLPGFDAVAKGEAVDVPRVMPHVVELVKSEVAKQPKIRAVLLECTELPPYADAVRAATKLPVLDAITIVDFFHAAVSENPYFGIDWEKLANTPAFA